MLMMFRTNRTSTCLRNSHGKHNGSGRPPLWPAARCVVLRIIFTLADFERCIIANKGNGTACAESQKSLSACASNAVPLLKTIKEECGGFIRTYDACISINAQMSDEQIAKECTPKLRDLWACTERVKSMSHNASSN